MLRPLLHSTMLVIPIASFLGCSATSTQPPATASADPVGCCCTFGDCRANFTQTDCVQEAEFQGWTYRWHAGACTRDDKAPVLETVPPPTAQH